MKYDLFLDDIRVPVEADDNTPRIVIIARSSESAIEVINTIGILPKHICFDHDLGGDDTAIVFINWLTEQVLDGRYVLTEQFTYSIHSQNPIGFENIKSKMNMLVDHCRTMRNVFENEISATYTESDVLEPKDIPEPVFILNNDDLAISDQGVVWVILPGLNPSPDRLVYCSLPLTEVLFDLTMFSRLQMWLDLDGLILTVGQKVKDQGGMIQIRTTSGDVPSIDMYKVKELD